MGIDELKGGLEGSPFCSDGFPLKLGSRTGWGGTGWGGTGDP